MSTVQTHKPSSSTYHVFLSFRSKDTASNTFTYHLYTSLLNAGFHTFIRNNDENVELKLGKEIQESRIAIIVLSKGFASSKWCLDEVVKIMEWNKGLGGGVLPVFYDVDPSDVRKQTGSFGEVFERYEVGFEGEMGESEKGWREKVKKWRAALKEVADLGGMVLQNQADGYESKFIQAIVKAVGRKLNRTILNVARYPIGIESRVKSINLWLQDESTNVGILAVYGIGGVGKTTIAKTVYNLNLDKFDGSSFLANIREASKQPNGLHRLQRQLLSNILRKKVKKIYNIDEGIMKIKDAVCCKRVLVVLDDVDELDQLNAVLGMREWFYPGSKIIITTRHERLLKGHEECEMYKVKEWNDKESLQLFSWHAFGQDHPFEGYTELSTNVVYHCGGIPLALQVLGSSLFGRSVDVWESALKKLRAIPDSDILQKLKISYDSLPDDHDKNLFLDIACFFVGKDKDYVVTVLDECDFYTIVGIENLIDRCLLTTDKDDKLLMHQLLQDMAIEMIHKESAHPGKRSRVCSHKDSYNVLKDKTGTETVRGLILDMQMLKEVKSVGTSISVNGAKRSRPEEFLDKLLLIGPGYSQKRRRLDFFGNSINTTSRIPDDIDFKTDAFTRMQNLRLLQLSYLHLTGCYETFPKKLRWLYWRGFPLKSLPTDFPLECLVALDMRNSSLTQVWNGTKFLRLLKILNFSHSHGLYKTPDFSGLPNLKRLILKDCIRLVELHESIGELERLVLLNLRDCKNLMRLPRKIGKLKSLEKLILSGCSKLEKLPVELGKLPSLTVLHADEIAANQLASTTGEAKSWRALFWSWVSKPGKSPESIKFSLASLSGSLLSLSLANCNLTDDAIPSDLRSLPFLQYLNLSENPIRVLPQSIIGLYMLKDLWLDSCTSLQSLPELPLSLIDLKAVNCTSLKRITNLPNLMKSLFLDVSGCVKLVEVQGLFKLEPIGSFDAEMINNLGFLNLESIENTEVELLNKLTKTRKKDLVQGLYEFGIFSTYLPGSEVPGWFSNKSLESSISFIVSSDPSIKIQGLNVCIVYGRSSEKKFQYWSNHDWLTYYIKVNNKTKGMKWIYSPTFIGIPGAKEDMTLLSNWKFGNQLEVGDEVSISAVGWSYTFQMKQFGISLVYDKEDEKKFMQSNGKEEEHTIQQNITYPYQSGIDVDISAYQLRPHAYFLSHPDFLVLRECSSENLWIQTVLYDNLFEDSVKVSGSTQGGSGGEEEDDDSYYDKAGNGDVEEWDEEDEFWLASQWSVEN